MEMRSKEFAVQAEAAEVTEADLALINRRFALAPLTAEQVYVRRLALCNDQYDRTSERFPRAYLDRFAETLPGKPLLAHHDKGQFPLGRFFRAEVVTVPAEEGGEGRRGAEVTWLYCWAYLVKTRGNEEVRAQIDAGVYSHVSIGFRWADLTCDVCGRSYFQGGCPHVIDQEYEGRRCTATYSGDPRKVEALEGSLVYLGAQYGAVVTKSDNRQAEKDTLAGQKSKQEPALAEDGRLYRADLRGEVLRLADCVGAGAEAEALVDALGDAPAGRLKTLVSDYQRRFDRLFALPAALRSASLEAPPAEGAVPSRLQIAP